MSDIRGITFFTWGMVIEVARQKSDSPHKNRDSLQLWRYG